MIGPIDPETLDNDQLKTYREVMALRERNADRIAKIEATGIAIDLATARTEHTLSALVHFGLITMDQLLELNKDWELELRRQTKHILSRREAAMAAAQAEAMRPKLYVPGQ